MSDPARPPAGYSGTPLARKLGIRAGLRVALLDAPDHLRGLLEPLPEGVAFSDRAATDSDLVHLFVTQRDDLAERLTDLRTLLDPAAVVWVSWPKRSSRVRTDVTEDGVRELALPLGFVDVKVCAVDEVWSALKLVVRKELRGAPG